MFDLEVYISKIKIISQFPCSRNVMAFLSRSKLLVTIFFRYIAIFGDPYLFIYLFIYLFLDHFYCFTPCEQCTSTNVFLVGIFPKNKLFVYALFTHCTFELLAFFTRKINKITYCFNRNQSQLRKFGFVIKVFKPAATINNGKALINIYEKNQ